MARAAFLVGLAGLGVGLFLWSRSSSGATAVSLSGSAAPLDALTDLAAAAVADVIGWEIPSRGQPYAAAIGEAEGRYGIPHNLLARLLYQESRFRPDIVTGAVKSSVGAQGIAQFMPATAAQFGIDPLNPAQAIDAAGKYLSLLYLQFGSWSLALAAYNWGPGNVARAGLDAAPAETKTYVAQITSDVQVA